jgi:hypothetical protein
MQTYRPRKPPRGLNVDQLADWMYSELQNIQRAANTGSDAVAVRVLNAEPARPQDGWEYNADGVNWDPGSGKGTYRYNASTASWTFLG